MTGETNFKSSKLYISRVQHPVFRIFLKFLANCVFGRPSNHLSRLVDVTVLAQYCQPHSYGCAYLPKSIITHLLSSITLKTAIACRGLITHIATRLPELYFQDSAPISPFALISLTFLKNGHDFRVQRIAGGGTIYLWTLNPNPNNLIVSLPNEDLNSHLSGQPHYCLQYVVPQSIINHLREEERNRKRRAGVLPSESENEEDENEEGEEESEEEGEESEEEERVRIDVPGPNQESVRRAMASSSSQPSRPSRPTPPPPQALPQTPSQMPPLFYFDEHFNQLVAGQQLLMEHMEAMSLHLSGQQDEILQ